MKYPLLFSFMLITMTGCATRTRQTDRLVKDHSALQREGHIPNVELFKQEKNHCGPATLAIVLNHAGKKISVEDLADTMMIKDLPGTYQADMLLAARNQGMQTIQLNNLNQILTEVSQGNPVIVFQNLGFSIMPKWHYAVVTGYNLKGPDVYLHTGNKRYEKTDMRFFERSWILGSKWALMLLPPDQLSATGTETEHVNAIAYFEGLKNYTAAKKGYETVLTKWQKSLSAHIGLGNVNYHLGDKVKSAYYLKKAVFFHPESAIAWHNLATVQGELGKIKDARRSSANAVKFASDESREQFKKSLKDYLIDLP